MNHRLSLFPQPGDVPTSRMCGTGGDIPVLVLGDHAELVFHDYDTALTYLAGVVGEALDLLEKVRVAQRKAELLAAVEATPADPARAAQIRTAYANEGV